MGMMSTGSAGLRVPPERPLHAQGITGRTRSVPDRAMKDSLNDYQTVFSRGAVNTCDVAREARRGHCRSMGSSARASSTRARCPWFDKLTHEGLCVRL